MSIILISSGKIKETDTSKEIIKWDTDQIKLWYYNVVEASIQDVKETIDVKAEIIEDSKCGYLIAPFDSNQLAERLVELAQNSELRKRMGHAGAIIARGKGTAGSKVSALLDAGVDVAKIPVEVPMLLRAAMKK